MKPLQVRCKLRGSADIVTRSGAIHLDGLLAAAVARRDRLPPILDLDDLVPIEIPVQRESGGRFHLCSMLMGSIERTRLRFVQRQFPVHKAGKMSEMKSVHLGSGAQKNFRIPTEAQRIQDDEMRGWLIGDPDEVSTLLQLVTHVGKHRARGSGRVQDWTVESVDETWEGFPVLADGLPLRPLPLDYPGLSDDAPREHARLTYPYWLPDLQEVVHP